MNSLSIYILPGILFLLTLAFGFWVSKAGKPYNVPLFNIHKLIALAAVVITIIRLSNALKTAASPALIIVLLSVAALCVVALFASGALMSLDKLEYALTLTTHRIAPALLVAALALAVYLLGMQP